MRGVIESMNGARFVHDRLEEYGWDVLIADATKVKGLAPMACKTDKIDARVLAALSARDLVPEIWLPDPSIRRSPRRSATSPASRRRRSCAATPACAPGCASPVAVDARGPISKHGPKYLRWALFEAALNACKHPYYAERFQHTKRRVGRQRGPKVAQIDLARRLTEAIWHMLTRNEPFAWAGAPFRRAA